MNKSPLIMGCPMSTSQTPSSSLDVLSNAEIIAINQDPLGQQARLIRRYSEQGYDLWVGNLSSSRVVFGIANWANVTQTVVVDLSDVLGVASANARDVWAKTNFTISGTYTTKLSGHQLQVLVLSSIVTSQVTHNPVGYYTAADAALSGKANVVTCSSTQCLPANKKISNIGQGASAAAVTFENVSAAATGTYLVGVDYINYDVALGSAWSGGTNTRNMTISVNGGKVQRWEFPISGGDWYETGRLWIEVSGFQAGSGNSLVFRASDSWAPDLVGFEIFE